jgi:hypothetical protein
LFKRVHRTWKRVKLPFILFKIISHPPLPIHPRDALFLQTFFLKIE